MSGGKRYLLEPIVIPTIEDLVRYYSGWRATRAGSAPVLPVRA